MTEVKTIDLCKGESKELQIAPCIAARYDAGICKHKLERAGVIEIKQATKEGTIKCKVGGCYDASYPDSKTRRGRVQNGGDLTPTLTASNSENIHYVENIIIKVGQISNEGSQCGTVVSDKGLSPTLSAGTHRYANAHIETQYRIRKLTPKECWRLMGYTDEDYEKAAAVNSNTQLYKQAGNAIVKQVLMAIFKQMIPESARCLQKK